MHRLDVVWRDRPAISTLQKDVLSLCAKRLFALHKPQRQVIEQFRPRRIKPNVVILAGGANERPRIYIVAKPPAAADQKRGLWSNVFFLADADKGRFGSCGASACLLYTSPSPRD